MNSPEWCQWYWNRISHRVFNKNQINKGRNLLVRSLCEQCSQLCNTVEVFKVTQQENGQDRRTRSTSSPLPWPSAQIPSSTYSLITPVDQWLASNGLLLITGSKCRICPFYTTFLRKSSALIWHFLWMTSDYHKQQVLLSGQHILLLDQPGKMYRGHVFAGCFVGFLLDCPCWLELSGVPAHPTLSNASCQPMAEEIRFHSLFLQPLKKERETSSASLSTVETRCFPAWSSLDPFL